MNCNKPFLSLHGQYFRTRARRFRKMWCSSRKRSILQNEMTPEGKIRIVIWSWWTRSVLWNTFLFLASHDHDTVFLTFDASKKLDAPVFIDNNNIQFPRRYAKLKTQTNYEAIETTLQAIYSHSGIEGNKDSLSPRIPTVVIVGTHAFNLTILLTKKRSSVKG